METVKNCFRYGELKKGDENEHGLPEKPLKFLIEVYKNWIDVDSQLDVAEVPTESLRSIIWLWLMNHQIIEQADTDDEEENIEAPPSSKEL